MITYKVTALAARMLRNFLGVNLNEKFGSFLYFGHCLWMLSVRMRFGYVRLILDMVKI